VRPHGAKLWRFNYRYLYKHRTLAFGAWPEVSLADARDRRDEARQLLPAGTDPSHQQKVDAARACVEENDTFKIIAEEWVAKNEREGMAEVTLSEIRWQLDKAYPRIGNRPVAKITAQEVLAALRAVEAAGRYESARRMRSVLSLVFRYAIATTRAERDPAGDPRGALTVPKSRHLSAITTPDGAGELMRAIEGYTGHAITPFALRLSAHLLVRPGELRQAEWSEFDFERSVWSIPAEKMKMRRPHRVSLSTQVVDLFEALSELTGGEKYCFPSFRSRARPMSENTVNAALRTHGFGQEQMTAHGFRAMAATLLNETGHFKSDAIEWQLAYMENNGVRRAYTRGEYWDERDTLMKFWSDELDRLRDGAKVLKLAFGRRAG
jgi:integrase